MRKILSLQWRYSSWRLEPSGVKPEEAVLGEVAGGLIGSFAGLYLASGASMLLRDSLPNEGAWNAGLSRDLV
jgi:hypothetical protein